MEMDTAPLTKSSLIKRSQLSTLAMLENPQLCAMMAFSPMHGLALLTLQWKNRHPSLVLGISRLRAKVDNIFTYGIIE